MSHSILIGRLGRSLARKRKMLWQLMFFVLGSVGTRGWPGAKERERYWIKGWMRG